MKIINTILLGAILVALILLRINQPNKEVDIDASCVTKIINEHNYYVEVASYGPLTITEMKKIIDQKAPDNEYTGNTGELK